MCSVESQICRLKQGMVLAPGTEESLRLKVTVCLVTSGAEAQGLAAVCR
jgi:hypothetical protein